MTLLDTVIDLQTTAPTHAVALHDVGITGIVRGIVVGADATPATASIDVSCALDADVRGAHMSRFHEAIDDALRLVGDDGRDVPSLELLAGVIASRAADLQDASIGRATVRVTLASASVAPSSGRRTVDPYDAWATVQVERSPELRSTVALGVRVAGMTACPCAQGLVRAHAHEALTSAQIAGDVVDRVLDLVPIATHNQRSTGLLEVVVAGDGAIGAVVDPRVLVSLVRGAMSTTIHELLKRDDELAVVQAAHAAPRFVEDCVRDMLAAACAADELRDLPPMTLVRAEQVNHESIHAHDVSASRAGTLAELREQLGLQLPAAPA